MKHKYERMEDRDQSVSVALVSRRTELSKSKSTMIEIIKPRLNQNLK